VVGKEGWSGDKKERVEMVRRGERLACDAREGGE
jgi:hypothetical protein